MKILKQNFNGSCLAACLISILRHKLNKEISDEEEGKILLKGLSFSMTDFTLGHLVYICEKFGVKIEMFLDSPYYVDFLQKMELPENLSISKSKINLNFLRNMSNQSPIVYIDNFYLRESIIEKCHLPHFVILSSVSNGKAQILDPFDGVERSIDIGTLMKSIKSLYNKLWLAPKVIIVDVQ